MEARYVKCQRCGERAIVYDAKVPTRGFKLSVLVVALIIVGTTWMSIYSAATHHDYNPASLIALVIIGSLVTIAAAIVLVIMASPRQGRVVICQHCLAKYGVSEPPRFVLDWNLDKFEKILSKSQDKH